MGLPCRLQNWTRRCGQLKEREADRAGGSRPSLWPGRERAPPAGSREVGQWAQVWPGFPLSAPLRFRRGVNWLLRAQGHRPWPLATAGPLALGRGGRGREFKAGAAPSLPAADAGQDAASGPRLPCVLAGDHQTWVPLCPLQGAVGPPLHVARTSPLATRRLQKAGLISKTGPPLAPRDGLCERSRSFRNER